MGFILNNSGMGAGFILVILPGVGRDRSFILLLAWDWDGTGLVSVGAGQDRSENPLPCQSLLHMVVQGNYSLYIWTKLPVNYSLIQLISLFKLP